MMLRVAFKSRLAAKLTLCDSLQLTLALRPTACGHWSRALGSSTDHAKMAMLDKAIHLLKEPSLPSRSRICKERVDPVATRIRRF